MWTAKFWRESAERAIKTIAQTILAFFVIGQTDIWTLDWKVVLSGAIVAGVASILSSLGSAPFGPAGSPSVVE